MQRERGERRERGGREREREREREKEREREQCTGIANTISIRGKNSPPLP